MTVQLQIGGVVQGVGFRPFVARLAQSLGITGQVRNDGGVVVVNASGSAEQLNSFTERLRRECPAGGAVSHIAVEVVPEEEYSGFCILESGDAAVRAVSIPPDLPLCADCARELADPSNRRYRYPFISCVACGPRYSIVESLPYDRPRTVMEEFPLCPDCQGEYTGTGRRRHAQTISCHRCGPQLFLRTAQGETAREPALERAASLLRQGAVLAVKGIGGYHLVCSPTDGPALSRLRAIKRREEKPFAVMFASLKELAAYCHITRAEEALLLSPARPIVLLERRPSAIHPAVYRQSRYLGAFLPYTPLQLLLLEACGPLVFTSANLTDQPILYQDADAFALLEQGVEGVLYTTRRIIVPLDDSVALVEGEPLLLRRSRGYVPATIPLQTDCKEEILAGGSDLKATLGYYRQGAALLSQPLGDLAQEPVRALYDATAGHMQRLFQLRPARVVADLHPAYASARYARSTGLSLVLVQHHHAHVASVMAEHNLNRVLGVAFDGTGWGEDGTVWGGEFLLCEGGHCRRVAHLLPVPVCGYDNAARDASLMALFYGMAAGLPVEDTRRELLQAALAQGVQVVHTSSMGRLFDGAAALLGLGTRNHYEGECAILLENAAADGMAAGKTPLPLTFALQASASCLLIDPLPLVRGLWQARQAGGDREAAALGFHLAIAHMVVQVCVQLAGQTGCFAVALSGGVFANRLLLRLCVPALQQAGFTVYRNQLVPPGDGGLPLGQLYLAAKQWEEQEENACV